MEGFGKMTKKSAERKLQYFLFRWVFILTVVSFFAGCAEVPLTRRKGLHIVPQSQILALSLQQYDKVLKESRLCKDEKKVNMVRRVGRRIAGAAEVDRLGWR